MNSKKIVCINFFGPLFYCVYVYKKVFFLYKTLQNNLCIIDYNSIVFFYILLPSIDIYILMIS